MARIIIIGGGVCGLTAGMLLARAGHEVTALERDPAAPPHDVGAAWERWDRRGVNQFRMLHWFQPRWRQIVEAELPELAKALDAAGALRVNPVAQALPYADGDEDFEALTGRRPMVESVMAGVAQESAGLTVRRGVVVEALSVDAGSNADVPHIAGVRTDGGEELRADLVVDMAGRRSALPRLLADAGARPPAEEVEDCGFIYYGRYFRSEDGSYPQLGGGLLTDAGSISVLTLPADNGTWGVGITASSQDVALRAAKDPQTWSRIVRSIPAVAHWIDAEPMDDDVSVMARIEDRHRRLVVDGTPVATGIVNVADSWACTNPSLGRGITIGTLHAVALRDTLATHDVADRAAFALAFDAATLATVEPWYRSTLAYDRSRLAEVNAAIAGEPHEPDVTWQVTKAMVRAGSRDPDVLRAFMRVASLLATTDEVMATPRMFEKILTAGGDWQEADPGPAGREQLLATIAG